MILDRVTKGIGPRSFFEGAMMKRSLRLVFAAMLSSIAAFTAGAQVLPSCAELTSIKIDGVKIANAIPVPAGAAVPPTYPHYAGALPAHCRVVGVIDRRKGVDGEEFGIEFALALPSRDAWNGDFMMQGGGGGDGIINYPVGAGYAGDKSALVRGFAVVSTDSGHKAKTGPFDFSFMRDQEAYLDFAYKANAEVAGVPKRSSRPTTQDRSVTPILSAARRAVEKA